MKIEHADVKKCRQSLQEKLNELIKAAESVEIPYSPNPNASMEPKFLEPVKHFAGVVLPPCRDYEDARTKLRDYRDHHVNGSVVVGFFLNYAQQAIANPDVTLKEIPNPGPYSCLASAVDWYIWEFEKRVKIGKESKPEK